MLKGFWHSPTIACHHQHYFPHFPRRQKKLWWVEWCLFLQLGVLSALSQCPIFCRPARSGIHDPWDCLNVTCPGHFDIFLYLSCVWKTWKKVSPCLSSCDIDTSSDSSGSRYFASKVWSASSTDAWLSHGQVSWSSKTVKRDCNIPLWSFDRLVGLC